MTQSDQRKEKRRKKVKDRSGSQVDSQKKCRDIVEEERPKWDRPMKGEGKKKKTTIHGRGRQAGNFPVSKKKRCVK